MKKQVQSFSEFTKRKAKVNEDFYYDYSDYGGGLATATLQKDAYVPNLAFGDQVLIEYQGKEAVTRWDGNTYESWSDIFNAAEKLGADSEQVKFIKDGRTKIIGRDILDSFYRKGAEFGDVDDFDNYPSWDV
jgi:hypothetical protein